MKTKQDIVIELKKQNPTIVSNINGEEIQLIGDEYEEAIQNVAQMKLEQLLKEEENKSKEVEKAALLDRLGITEEEARILLGGN
jgi:hypothetical protein